MNPSLTRSDSLANSKHTERLEDAIRLNHLIEIEFFSSSAKLSNSKKEKFVEVWPIQLIFHNIGWYLAYELKEFSSSKGPIQTVRLDRISLRKIDFSRKRTENEIVEKRPQGGRWKLVRVFQEVVHTTSFSFSEIEERERQSLRQFDRGNFIPERR